tara:strand:+ start:1888 stop:3546 length:1659 start_codon:yes stop_codon:yes gene_type:complete
MAQTFYWKGQTGAIALQNINTVYTGASHNEKEFLSQANNWNMAANWAVEVHGGTYGGGDPGGGTNPPNGQERFFVTPASWPKAGDKVVFDKITDAWLDGASGNTGETWPYSECLYGGTTNDYKWFDGSSTAGKLEQIYIGPGYDEHLLAVEAQTSPNFGKYCGRIGSPMDDAMMGVAGTSGPNEGLGIYAAEIIDEGFTAAPEWAQGDQPWRLADWKRSRTFSSNFRCDNLIIKGAGIWDIRQDGYKRGCTIGNIYLERTPQWETFSRDESWDLWRRRAPFYMKGDTVNYSITSYVKIASTIDSEVNITSRTTVPTLLIGSRQRFCGYNPSKTVEINGAPVATCRIYPTIDEFNYADDGAGTSMGNYSVVFSSSRDGVSGASGPGYSSYHGVSIGHLYMEDTNPFHTISYHGGNITGGKNNNGVMIDLTHPNNAGATISNLYQYSGQLYPKADGATFTTGKGVYYRILNGEINSNCVLMGYDPANIPWTGFEIAGHTLGIAGANNGLLSIDTSADVRLVKGARISTTTAKADQTAILTDSSVSWSDGGGGKG